MKRSELQYELPRELIAQSPASRRADSRLMVVRRGDGSVRHSSFRQLGEELRSGDLLVLNDTRVLPARFWAQRQTGGAVEGLFLQEVEAGLWSVLLRSGGRLRVGELLRLAGTETTLTIEQAGQGQPWRVRVEPARSAAELLQQVGRTPLPPYIHRQRDDSRESEDRQRYQTVYASRPGAVAAPTAGLHFTPQMLEELVGRGIQQAAVTLHVGAGTFQPIQVDDLADHVMDPEWYELPAATAAKIERARAAGGRIVAVGTTTTRVLESCVSGDGSRLNAGSGWTNLFITPGYRFRVVDVLLTNFHLPESTLLALVFAFAGRELILSAYGQAIAAGYRFYSYGDAMLIV